MWQPIETAPRNQAFLAVLNCAGEQTICTMRWPVAEAKNSRPEVWGRHVERVTHWMPLPDLPGAQPAPSVPDGWKLVPTEPTKEMRAAWDSSPICEDDDAEFRRAYSEMLAAAPEAKP